MANKNRRTQRRGEEGMSGGAYANCDGCEETRKVVRDMRRLVLILEREAANLRETITYIEKDEVKHGR